MDVSLTPASEQVLQQKMAAGESANAVVEKALRFCFPEAQRQLEWLREQLHCGEESGEAILFTLELLYKIEQEALAELAARDPECAPNVWLE